MNKKAALNLSINAIVTVILAIAFLGVAITFKEKIFGIAEEEFKEVRGRMLKEMIDQMKKNEKTIDLSGVVHKLGRNDKKVIYIGFKNDDYHNNKKFIIKGIKSSSLSGNDENCGAYIDENNVIVEYKKKATYVRSGETIVIPMNIRSNSDVEADSCFFEVLIGIEDENLVGYWNFNYDNTEDLSGNDKHGIMMGANWTKQGYIQAGYNFMPLSGSGPPGAGGISPDPYIELTGIERETIDEEITVSAFVTINDVAQQYSYIANKREVFNFFLQNTEGNIQFCIDLFGVINGRNNCAERILERGKSYRLAFTYDDAEEKIKMYINGNKEYEVDSGGFIQNMDSNSYIGYPSSFTFNGIIDEVHIYNVSLTDSKIKQLSQGYDASLQMTVNIEY